VVGATARANDPVPPAGRHLLHREQLGSRRHDHLCVRVTAWAARGSGRAVLAASIAAAVRDAEPRGAPRRRCNAAVALEHNAVGGRPRTRSSEGASSSSTNDAMPSVSASVAVARFETVPMGRHALPPVACHRCGTYPATCQARLPTTRLTATTDRIEAFDRMLDGPAIPAVISNLACPGPPD